MAPKSARQIRLYFKRDGISISDWARQMGVSYSLTRHVLTGRRKCLRGESHRIASLLQRLPEQRPVSKRERQPAK